LFKEVIKPKELFIRSQYIYQFICDVIRKSARETSSFCGCHSKDRLAGNWNKSDSKKVEFTLF
jgi:hypothetical protein